MERRAAIYDESRRVVLEVLDAYDRLVDEVETYESFLSSQLESAGRLPDPKGLALGLEEQLTFLGVAKTSLEDDVHDALTRMYDRLIRLREWQEGRSVI